MDSAALQQATLDCLLDHDTCFSGATIKSVTPISGGYSRQTLRYEIEHGGHSVDYILQYLPKGATGIVRVDRRVEHDVLKFLTQQSNIPSSKLVAADVDAQFFDNAAFIYKAEAGRPFLELCRNAPEAEYGDLNRIMARAAAKVHQQDISELPQSLVRPNSWEDYLSSQIEMFRQTERDSATARPFLRHVAKWLDDNRPVAAPLSLVHGDFQTGNMMAGADEEDGVLVDWELAHIGDPREDLGWFTMVCNAVPPNILGGDIDAFYNEYREKTGFSEEVINPATSAYFLIISSIRTHMGMMKSSDALIESPKQSQPVLAAYYMTISSFQHTMWMQSIEFVKNLKKGTS